MPFINKIDCPNYNYFSLFFLQNLDSIFTPLFQSTSFKAVSLKDLSTTTAVCWECVESARRKSGEIDAEPAEEIPSHSACGSQAGPYGIVV